MTAAAGDPWWASGDGEGRVDDADPVTAHRQARRGGPDPDAEDGGVPPPGDAAQDPAPDHDPDVCGVCPWCAGLRALAASHPEAVTHLTEAARHLTHAVRALLHDLQPAADREDPAADDRAADDPDDQPFERIDLD